MTGLIHRSTVTAMILAVAGGLTSPAVAQGRPRDVVTQRTAAVMDDLVRTGDLERAETELAALFDSLIGYAAIREVEAFRETACHLRLVRQLKAADLQWPIDTITFLRDNPTFARALAFAARPDQEKMKEVYALVDRFRQERGDRVEKYANLAAAICVVHDRPLRRNYNENVVSAPDPIALFDFFLANEKRMTFGLTGVPAELLIYVVDATASIEELHWAAAKYAGHPAVGSLFFDIQYDYDHYRTGAPKKSTQAGWNLPNILRYGGVCADQAYYAVTVGKAIGVPTAYTIGVGADVSHAWVGFLQADKRQAWWNFETGRYDAYIGLKGLVFDPQIRRPVNDSQVALLAAFALSRPEDRCTAAAFVDAAARLNGLSRDKASFDPRPLSPPPGGRAPRPIRSTVVKDQLALLEAGLKASPGYADGWFLLRGMAADGLLSLDDKKTWAGVLDRLCGQRFPDFSLSILIPMIESVEDVKEQDTLWNNVFRSYQGRHDLAAEVRMKQAEMWEKRGEVNRAGDCYLDVIRRYANAGPFVITALAKAEKLLRDSNRAAEVPALYAAAWQSIQRPEDMAGQFAVQSNWYRVGMLYAGKLEEAGQNQMAAQVRATVKGS
ncbi:MAG: hypothetical protein HRU76_00275 [Phycisphaeraceae bacterium]|nr:hypothetical protein [Phycisphaerales bacterium]QOJ16126.1 MAG: hypothetical protein HRU76_00275 [Phycisphaeraceae bacterium]